MKKFILGCVACLAVLAIPAQSRANDFEFGFRAGFRTEVFDTGFQRFILEEPTNDVFLFRRDVVRVPVRRAASVVPVRVRTVERVRSLPFRTVVRTRTILR